MGRCKSSIVLTPDEETALRVLIKTSYVQNWAKGELSFLGTFRPDSPEGKKFLAEHTRQRALKILGKI